MYKIMLYSEFIELSGFSISEINQFDYNKFIEKLYGNSRYTRKIFCSIFRKLYIEKVSSPFGMILKASHYDEPYRKSINEYELYKILLNAFLINCKEGSYNKKLGIIKDYTGGLID